jgi:hypothetical protein
VLGDEALRERMGEAGARTARKQFCDSKIVPVYEAYYAEILGK